MATKGREELRQIAMWQRLTIAALILSVAVDVAASRLTQDKQFGWLLLCGLVYLARGLICGKLARAIGSGKGWGFLAFLPSVIGLAVVLFINARASSLLRLSGVKVGLLGADVS